MHRPAFHESALVAFFRRHGLTAPYIDADGLIERHGLVLAMAFGLRAARYRVVCQPDGGAIINGEAFAPADVRAAKFEAFHAADRIETILDNDGWDHHLDAIDRMALIAIRLAAANISVTPDTLVTEGGVPGSIVAEHGMVAVQLAEAMRVAINFWRNSARERAARLAVRELEAA